MNEKVSVQGETTGVELHLPTFRITNIMEHSWKLLFGSNLKKEVQLPRESCKEEFLFLILKPESQTHRAARTQGMCLCYLPEPQLMSYRAVCSGSCTVARSSGRSRNVQQWSWSRWATANITRRDSVFGLSSHFSFPSISGSKDSLLTNSWCEFIPEYVWGCICMI